MPAELNRTLGQVQAHILSVARHYERVQVVLSIDMGSEKETLFDTFETDASDHSFPPDSNLVLPPGSTFVVRITPLGEPLEHPLVAVLHEVFEQ